jgi:hypothetical protein
MSMTPGEGEQKKNNNIWPEIAATPPWGAPDSGQFSGQEAVYGQAAGTRIGVGDEIPAQ